MYLWICSGLDLWLWRKIICCLESCVRVRHCIIFSCSGLLSGQYLMLCLTLKQVLCSHHLQKKQTNKQNHTKTTTKTSVSTTVFFLATLLSGLNADLKKVFNYI